MALEVQGLGRSLDAAPDGALFLQELLAKWQQHAKAVSVIRDILMYMDRTFVPTTHKTPVGELGLQPVARRHGPLRQGPAEADRGGEAREGRRGLRRRARRPDGRCDQDADGAWR